VSKCDFCDKESVGYCSMQVAIYCEDHKEKAEQIEADMWKATEDIEDDE
jgi:hypothetical protein